MIDFGILVLLVELGGLWYVAATAVGAASGALTNFLMGRYWSFKARHGTIHGQAFRYVLVSGLSLLLNSGGVYLLTDRGGLFYTESKLVVAVLVGFGFNFPMHRFFVFRGARVGAPG